MTMKTAHDIEESALRSPEVVAWRLEQLLGVGFDLELSDKLARECGIDLHALVELVEHGCPPRLAAQILTPLEGESRRC